MASQSVAEAQNLLQSGQVQEGLGLLGMAASKGDPEAFFMLAELHLVGRVVHRDFALSRDLFRRAAEAGSHDGTAVYRALVANGTGAPADWPRAIELLEAAATNDPKAVREVALIAGMQLTDHGAPAAVAQGEPLSSSPEVRLFPGLFTSAECDFLVDVAMPRLAPSFVVDPRTRQMVPSPLRSSHGATFPPHVESPAVHALSRRLAAASGTDVSQGEPLQVLRYSAGQEYRPHFDAIDGAENQRTLTFLVYLNDGYEGGETQFLATGLKVSGKKGDGLLFRNADDSGRRDPNAKHAGLPPTTGEKFIASRWIRQRPLLAGRT